MRKLTLKLEELSVESFEAEAEARQSGTVMGHDSDGTCYQTCQEADTCDLNVGTCDFLSCDGVCGSYWCATGSSCGQFSCVWTCNVNC